MQRLDRCRSGDLTDVMKWMVVLFDPPATSRGQSGLATLETKHDQAVPTCPNQLACACALQVVDEKQNYLIERSKHADKKTANASSVIV